MEFLTFLIINIVRILKYALLLRVLLSWVQINPQSQFARILYEITEPLLRIFRNFLPRGSRLDFSPILAFLALDLAQLGVISLLANLS